MGPSPGSEYAQSAWTRLWSDVRPSPSRHPVNLPELGEYASILQRRGVAVARSAFPAVAEHFESKCPSCIADLEHILQAVKRMDEPTLPDQVRVLVGDLEVGVMPVERALEYAQAAGVMLQEDMSSADPPIWRVVEAPEVRKVHKVRIYPSTSETRLESHIGTLRRNLETGHSILIDVRFRSDQPGRGIANDPIDRIFQSVADIAAAREKMDHIFQSVADVAFAPDNPVVKESSLVASLYPRLKKNALVTKPARAPDVSATEDDDISRVAPVQQAGEPTVASLIRAARVALDFSYAELSSWTRPHVSADTLESVEGGRLQADSLTLEAICHALQLEPDAKTKVLTASRNERRARPVPTPPSTGGAARTARLRAYAQSSAMGRSARSRVWEPVLRELTDEAERVIAELSFVDDLKPAEIAERRPDLFASIRDVYRIKRNVLGRLGRRLRESPGEDTEASRKILDTYLQSERIRSSDA